MSLFIIDLLQIIYITDKYGKAEYSQFLACVILRMWGDRDESSEDTPKANKPGRSGLDALDPNRFINENWGGD